MTNKVAGRLRLRRESVARRDVDGPSRSLVVIRPKPRVTGSANIPQPGSRHYPVEKLFASGIKGMGVRDLGLIFTDTSANLL